MRRLPDGVRMVLIAGPTASGKSSLALRLAERIGGEIVNADALQLYGDLRLLTARPDAAEEARAPHHLFGVADAADGWSAGRWLRAAGAVLDEIAARGRPAIVVGGTGLYFQALTQGIAAIPPIPAQAREAAVARLAALGEAAFRAELAAFDPRAEARIAPGDHRRLTRAYEVHAVSGQALSDLQAAAAHGAQPPGAWTAVALEPPREALYRRGEARLARMVAEGVLGEVARLAARGLDPELPAMKAVGMREFAAHLRGETSLDEALAAAQRATRNYAKRQITWRRGRMADWPRLTAADPQDQWGQFLALHRALTP